MNRNSIISLIIGVVLGAGGYYILDRDAGPAETEAQPMAAEETEALPPVAAGMMEAAEEATEAVEAEAEEVSEALSELDPGAMSEPVMEPVMEPETEP